MVLISGAVVLDIPDSEGISKGAMAGIILVAIAGAVIFSAALSIFIMRRRAGKYQSESRNRLHSRVSIKLDGVRDFTFGQMARATNNFQSSSQIGQGGYGKVYKGTLADGMIIAVKRILEGSLQGEREFLTEIQLLSRVHHRNLISLIGFCNEEGEQMLVYEFIPNGTLRDHLSIRSKRALGFATRLKIALDSAKGILRIVLVNCIGELYWIIKNSDSEFRISGHK
ncbi:hypothetical protein ACHQM5_007862 [Ranunculus cassubicifolius]